MHRFLQTKGFPVLLPLQRAFERVREEVVRVKEQALPNQAMLCQTATELSLQGPRRFFVKLKDNYPQNPSPKKLWGALLSDPPALEKQAGKVDDDSQKPLSMNS